MWPLPAFLSNGGAPAPKKGAVHHLPGLAWRGPASCAVAPTGIASVWCRKRRRRAPNPASRRSARAPCWPMPLLCPSIWKLKKMLVLYTYWFSFANVFSQEIVYYILRWRVFDFCREIRYNFISRQKLNFLPWFVYYFIFNHLSKFHRTFNKSFSWNVDC